jgi:hypothetical protein
LSLVFFTDRDLGVRLLVVVGKVPFPALATSFVNTVPRIAGFLERHTPPLIAKVYRASPADLARDAALLVGWSGGIRDTGPTGSHVAVHGH